MSFKSKTQMRACFAKDDPEWADKTPDTKGLFEKKSDVNNLTQMTAMDAVPQGDENHAPLTRNPYYSPVGDPQAAIDYENGYQFAQKMGHGNLGQVDEEDILNWQNQSVPWREGMAEGARRLGMGRVADMLMGDQGGNMSEPSPNVVKMGAVADPDAPTQIIPRSQAKTERMTRNPGAADTKRTTRDQNQVPTQRMAKSAAMPYYHPPFNPGLIAGSTIGGAIGGGLRGMQDPGVTQTTDEEGNVTEVPRSKAMGALRGALGGGVGGALLGGGASRLGGALLGGGTGGWMKSAAAASVARDNPSIKKRNVNISATAPKKPAGPSGPTFKAVGGLRDTTLRKVAEHGCFKPKVVAQQKVDQSPEEASTVKEKKKG